MESPLSPRYAKEFEMAYGIYVDLQPMALAVHNLQHG
jgi:hypothetical protein